MQPFLNLATSEGTQGIFFYFIFLKLEFSNEKKLFRGLKSIFFFHFEILNECGSLLHMFYVAICMFAPMFFKRSDITYLNVKINFAPTYFRSDGCLSADTYLFYIAFYSIFSFLICNPSQNFDSKNKTKKFFSPIVAQ